MEASHTRRRDALHELIKSRGDSHHDARDEDASPETPHEAGAELVDDSEATPAEPPPPMLSPEAAAVLAALPHASTPYLTCSRCNSVSFINVLHVRPREEAKDESRLHEFEQLPICTGCGSTKYLRAGVVSFQEKIAEEQNAIKEFERKRGPATALLQRIARGFLGRLEFRRRKVARERYLRQINRAATRIQTRTRGMQARRRTVIERCLRLIQTMHPSILAFALAARLDRPPVFWYDNPAERSVFFWNYREFVRRAGGRPPLIKVETNVLEITRRMLLREYVLVSRIQARWRGITTRLVFREFKRQRAWLRGIQQSPAIKIQRLFRGHSSRKRCRALRVTTQYPSQLVAYREARREQEEREKRKAFRAKLLGKYRLEYQVNKTTRMMALQVMLPSSNALRKQHIASALSDEIGPETHAHVQHSLKSTSAAQSVGTTATTRKLLSHARRKRANQRDEDTNNLLSIRESKRDDSSSNSDGASDSDGGSSSNHGSDDTTQQRHVPKNRNANSQRFAEIKRKLERRHRTRDPRTHILQAQLYAVPSARSPVHRPGRPGVMD